MPASTQTLLVCADAPVIDPGRAALEAAGFQIHRAVGWADALAVFQGVRPSTVLVDGSFLDGAGPRLCAALRRMSGRVEVPLLALCHGKGEVRRALEAGASDVVEKPLDWEVVRRRLDCLYQAFSKATELERQRLIFAESHRRVARAWDRAERQTLTDALTGLPNRARLHQVLTRALAGSRAGTAVVVLDVDRFSEINELLGRRAADEALVQVASRLRERLRTRAAETLPGPGLTLLARLGGDEFAVAVTDSIATSALSAFAQGLLGALSDPFHVADTEVFLSASCGVAATLSGEETADALLQHAETAVYEAKRRGDGSVQLYSESLNGALEQKLGLDRRLRGAIERDELSLHFQPVIAPEGRRVLGVEALLRWQDPDRGFIPPAEFVPAAEDTGLMTTIGTWVLERACRQLQEWIEDGLPPIRMAVNVSRCQLERGDLAAELQRILEETGVDPGLLELEISERGTLRADPGILAQLRRLKALGVRVMVDDFGTGQSAIAYLRQFPLDGLKIDRSFVKDIASCGDDAAITSAIVAMAHRLRLDVVAEGVETEPQLQLMHEYGCEAIQGYFYSRPLPPRALRASLACEDGVARWHAVPPGGES